MSPFTYQARYPFIQNYNAPFTYQARYPFTYPANANTNAIGRYPFTYAYAVSGRSPFPFTFIKVACLFKVKVHFQLMQ